jgi:arsenate reductase
LDISCRFPTGGVTKSIGRVKINDKPRVLFLCTGNSARSQMAEALLRHYAGDRFEVYSAGLEPKGLNPYSVHAMDEIGIDIRSQQSKSVAAYLGKMVFGYVITVCSNAEANCPTFPGYTIRQHWPFDDPAAAVGSDEEIMDKFRQVRDQIAARIQGWLVEQGISLASGYDLSS